MRNKLSGQIALFLTVTLLVLMLIPATVSAATFNYVALGDSIGAGLSAEAGKSYADLYYAYLDGKDRHAYTYENFSVPGYTTANLIDEIGIRSTAIRGGEVITVSIGSNNLLGPAIQAILDLYGIPMVNDPEDPAGINMVNALFTKVQTDYLDFMIDPMTPEQRFAQLMDPSNTKAQQLYSNWTAGTMLFKLHWPIIMTRLRLRAPFAKVYVNNLYNPLTPSVMLNSGFAGLSTVLQSFMDQINATINRYGSLYHYKVVNVMTPFADAARYTTITGYESMFAAANDPVTFNIPGALMIAGYSVNPIYSPLQVPWQQLFTAACDPHPTTAGHKLIFDRLVLVGK